MKTTVFTFRTLCMAAVAIVCLQLLTACTKSGEASVNIHGVNYTDQEFSYRLEDPSNPQNHGGGEMVNAFSAAGTLCCYELPRSWRPGIQVQVHTIRWKEKLDNDTTKPIEEVREVHLVEVPEYKGKPGELWVLRQADGQMALVSSDEQPDHPKWPGAVKGWPEPSVAYMRKQADMYIKDAEERLKSTQESLTELEHSPGKIAKEIWDGRQEHIAMYAKRLDANLPSISNGQDTAKQYRDQLSKFKGPDDLRFVELLKSEDRYFLDFYEKKLARLKAERP